MMAAIVILWFALTRDDGGGDDDWKIITTASVWRQLVSFLWPEIHKWARLLKWDVIGCDPLRKSITLLNTMIKLKTGSASAIASGTPEQIEGAHAKHLLYVFDEAKIIPRGLWNSAEGAFAAPDTSEAMALAISTPGAAAGYFYDIHSRKPGHEDWWVRHVTLDEAIEARRISEKWAEARKREWGETSAIYRNRVLGEFAVETEMGVIPLAWVEAANERWYAWEAEGFPGRCTSIGADVGGGQGGGDLSAMAIVYGGTRVREVRTIKAALDPAVATMEFAGVIYGAAQKLRPNLIFPDAIGVGAGLYNRLVELGVPAVPFIASYGTQLRDATGEMGFNNWRSAMWWLAREMLNPESGFNICLPPDDALIGELVSPQYRVLSAGKYQIEGKETLRKRLGKSTDVADSVLQALVGPALWNERQQSVSTDRRAVYAPRRFGY